MNQRGLLQEFAHTRQNRPGKRGAKRRRGLRILVACEFSARVRDAFRKAGHDAWSCDLLPCEGDPKYHHQCDVRDVLDDDWDRVVAHPDCKFLANSGVRWLYAGGNASSGLLNHERWGGLRDGAEFFRLFTDLGESGRCQVCIENPVMHKFAKALIGTDGPSQIVQPYQFGHKAMKATGLWLYGLPELEPTDYVGPPPRRGDDEYAKWAECHYASPGPDRWKFRSRTYQGIADAMAAQWG